ncbi:MAG: hypothetical protein ACKO01_08450 [Erythrobacter sp.]
MAISLTICNLALGDVRAPAISDPGDASVEAQYCRLYYPHALDVMLDDYCWNWTKKIAPLAALATNERSTEWQYAYALPDNCAKALRIIPSAIWVSDFYNWRYYDAAPPTFWSQFIVENGALYTNVSDAVLEYSESVAEEAKFPPLFREALRRTLAAFLAVPLRDSAEMEARLEKKAAAAREQAMAVDMNRAEVLRDVDDVAFARR